MAVRQHASQLREKPGKYGSQRWGRLAGAAAHQAPDLAYRIFGLRIEGTTSGYMSTKPSGRPVDAGVRRSEPETVLAERLGQGFDPIGALRLEEAFAARGN